ncbi:MAG: hypothetical protein SNJ70_02385, partial [Armatimonadota bacterium]
MARAQDGSLHACWISGNNLVYRKYQGGSWSTLQTIASGGFMLYPRIAVDSTGKPAIVYLDDSLVGNYVLKFTRWTGASWTSPQVIGYGHYPSIAID